MGVKGAVGGKALVHNGGGGGHQVQVILALKALLHRGQGMRQGVEGWV